MVKWQATLSTTESYNYIGILNVRQGNRNTEVLEAILVENALPLYLTGCEVFFESVIDKKYPIQRAAKIVNAKKGIIQYTFDEYSMQSLHRQEAYFSIYKGDDLIGTTQNFSYFVINAASKTEGEMGSYWQSIEDLIADMTAFINENKGDFTDWMNARKEEFEAWRKNQQDAFEAWRQKNEKDFETWFTSIQDILKSVDPGGVLLNEIVLARLSEKYGEFNTLDDRLENIEAILTETELNEELITIKHDSKQYPHVVVTTWTNGLGVTGIGTKTAFGSVPETIPHTVQYPDFNTITVLTSKNYQLKEPRITKSADGSYLIAGNGRGMRIRLFKEEK
ncbi:BppU family phage baseplate upper protein [Escherichia coli]|uniref:BppU family phage baseplate upper protein n=1 Tax=Escherichia coli TaxID=562 RepID=UPI003F462C6A